MTSGHGHSERVGVAVTAPHRKGWAGGAPPRVAAGALGPAQGHAGDPRAHSSGGPPGRGERRVDDALDVAFDPWPEGWAEQIKALD